MAKLTAKQRRFCDEYLIDLNATQAAIRAGYSPDTANVIGSENLAKPYIQQRIQKQMDERAARTNITQDKVIEELAKIAFSDICNYLKVENNQVKIFDTDSIQKEVLAAIAEIRQGNYGLTIKLYDKLKALELLGRHLGMFKDKLEITGTVESNPFAGLTTEELKVILQKI